MKQLERAGRRLGLAVARRVATSAPLSPSDVDLARIERVLVVRQDRRLGNLVLLTSLLLGLRRAIPRAEIGVVVPRVFAGILDPHPAVDRIIALDHRRLIRSPWKVAAWRGSLRSTRPDLAIDASPIHSGSFLGGLITWASGASYRLGYDRENAQVFLNLLAPAAPPGPLGPTHESVLLHDLLRFLCPDLPPAPPPQVMVPASARELAVRAYRRWGIADGTPVVGLHPGGRRKKRWPIENFEAVARGLTARGAAVVVFSGPAERPLLEAMAPPGPLRIYAPPTDVRGLRTLVCGLDAFVSGDCGPMHLAAALEVPSIAIFRIDDHARYGPRGSAHRVLFAGSKGEVEEGEVVAAVLAVLAARQGRSLRRAQTEEGRRRSRASSAATRPHPTDAAGRAGWRSSPRRSGNRR